MRSIAGISVALAALPTVAAVPAGAAPVAAVRANANAPQPSKTPMCIVQAALFLPLFLGSVMMFNPTYLPQAAGDYWNGNGQQGSDAFPGWLNKCGI